MAGLLCLWVLVLVLARGSVTLRSRHGGSDNAVLILVLYVAAGLVAGALFGAAQPLMRFRGIAALIGVLVAAIFGSGLALGEVPISAWDYRQVLTIVVFAIAFGAPGGLIVREFVLRQRRRKF